jgi:hypothetical protein
MRTLEFTVKLTQIEVTTWAQDADTAINMVLEAEKAPFEAFVSVYQNDPVPKVSAKYGAPMGRGSGRLDFDSIKTWKADLVPLDEDGADAGGAYWGLRLNGKNVYAVQDGVGNLVFVDAKSEAEARQIVYHDETPENQQ